MRIRKILHRDLENYIHSSEYKETQYVAISKHRALSHIHNPRVRADDLVLVLIYEQEEMVAYLGVFADDLHFKNSTEHVGWLSCMWVNPKMRGKGIAKKLIQTVFDAWEYKILVTEFTPAAYGLYQRTEQFLDLAKPKGLRLYRRLNLAYLLPKKDSKWIKWKWGLKLIDAGFNLFNDMRLRISSKKVLPRFEYLAYPDKEVMDFVAPFKGNELICRGEQDWKWLLQHPWLLTAPLEDANSQRYHFSALDKRFNFLCIKIFDKEHQIISFMILSIRDQSMKIPYLYAKKENLPLVVQVINAHMKAMNLDIFTCFQPALVRYFQEQSAVGFFKKRAFQRHYIIGKVLQKQLEETLEFSLQDGDADAVFT